MVILTHEDLLKSSLVIGLQRQSHIHGNHRRPSRRESTLEPEHNSCLLMTKVLKAILYIPTPGSGRTPARPHPPDPAIYIIRDTERKRSPLPSPQMFLLPGREECAPSHKPRDDPAGKEMVANMRRRQRWGESWGCVGSAPAGALTALGLPCPPGHPLRAVPSGTASCRANPLR